MEKTLFLAVLVIISVACQEAKYELSIDNNCPEYAVQAIEEMVETCNTFTRSLTGEDYVDLQEKKVNVDHSRQLTRRAMNDNQSVIACFGETERDIVIARYGDKFLGEAAQGKDVNLFLFKIKSVEKLKAVILHELGHFIGIWGEMDSQGHVENEEAVMAPYADSSKQEFTHWDAEAFCSTEGCNPTDWAPMP